MDRGSDTSDRRRIEEALLAGGFVLALALLVVSLPTIAAAMGGDNAEMADRDPVEETPFAERSALIGGGAGGAAAESRIGVETGSDATTPFRNTSAEREFTVRTAAPMYWRTDAYDRYDGRWIRTGSHSTYAGSIPAVGPVTTPVRQNVTVEREAAVLPAAYQPARVSGTGTDSVTVSPETGIHPSDPVEADSTYTIDSYRYRPDLDVLRGAGANYPLSIERRYTQLPDDVPDRVDELGTELTADADTPFEAANTIDGSLAADKAYDLEATHEPGADPVDQFLFEMDGGDAQYFASSMVVLLRTQGVPARYVAGYSVGEPLPDEDGAYAVRSVNAHAWVEVYFSGHGWVAFDPTPVEDRIAVEDEAVGREGAMAHVPLANENASSIELDLDRVLDDPLPTDDTDLVDVDSEGNDADGDDDTPEADAGEGADEDGNDREDDADGGDGTGSGGESGDDRAVDGSSPDGLPPLAVDLSTDTPQPGETITVTVTRDGDPVRGATVLFDGTSIGETDESGVVRGTVPYVRTLEIVVTTGAVPDSTASIGGVSTDAAVRAPTVRSPAPENVGGWGHDEGSRPEVRFRPASPASGAATGTTDTGAEGRTSTASDVPDEPAHTRPMRTRTEEADENTTVISVPIDAATSIDVAPDPLVSGGEATVRMLVNGQPVPSAEVRIDDELLGETNDEGRLGVTIPETVDGDEIPVRVRRGGIEATRTVVAGQLGVTVTHDGEHPLPWRTATIEASVGPVPVEGATVRQDGTVVGDTGVNGTATASLPFARSTTFAVSHAGVSATQSVGGIARNGGVLGGSVLVGVLALGAAVRRYVGDGTAGSESPRRLGRLMDAGVRVGVWVTARLLAIQTALAGAGSRVITALAAPGTVVRRLWSRRPKPIWGPVVRAVVTLAAIAGRPWGSDSPAAPDGAEARTGSGTGSTERSVLSVRRAWATFVRLLGRRVDMTRTPAELARVAIDRGFPREPVERLTESFRVVEYGRGDPDQHADTAATALADIRATADGDAEDTPRSTEDES